MPTVSLLTSRRSAFARNAEFLLILLIDFIDLKDFMVCKSKVSVKRLIKRLIISFKLSTFSNCKQITQTHLYSRLISSCCLNRDLLWRQLGILTLVLAEKEALPASRSVYGPGELFLIISLTIYVSSIFVGSGKTKQNKKLITAFCQLLLG